MEQQQNILKISLGTKLLASVVTLLFVVILFLNLTTIFILREDKITNTYQMQSTEAQLIAKDYTYLTTKVLETLRLGLSSIDPRRPTAGQSVSGFESVVSNQSSVIHMEYRLLQAATKTTESVVSRSLVDEVTSLKLKPEDLKLPDDLLLNNLSALLSKQYLFFNFATLGKPLMAVVLADTNLKDNPLGVPVAIGIVSLEKLSAEAKASDLTVADMSGWVLFDSDPGRFFSKANVAKDPLFEIAKKSVVETGATAYEVEDKKYLGSYFKSSVGVVVLAKTGWAYALRATYDLTEKFILLGLVCISGAIIFALFFSKSLTAPLNALTEATKEVAAGNFELNLTAKSSDEIGILSSSFNLMSGKIQELILESVEKTKIEGELAIASTVQQTLFPPETAEGKNFDIKSFFTPASQVGGDWWGFFETDQRLYLMVADATGHGFPSALITAAARSCFSVIERLSTELPNVPLSPKMLLSFANRAIYDAAKGQIMMTFFVGAVDFTKKELTYASAGHNPPWFYKKTGNAYKLKALMASGQRLGEARENVEFEEKTVAIDNGDILLLYTDGVLEGKNLEGEQYGKKRARQVVETGLKVGLGTAVQSLAQEFLKFNEGKELDDDVTIAATEFKGLT